MEHLMDDSYSKVPAGTEWCPECNGYGSSLRGDRTLHALRRQRAGDCREPDSTGSDQSRSGTAGTTGLN
jgi:hypothetical protein